MQNLLAASLFASSDDGGSSAGGVIQFAILLLIPVAMYFLLIRPQRRRMKDQQAMQRALGVGDEVVTNSGIYGFIKAEEADFFWLEIDDDVMIRIAKAAIQNKVAKPADSDAADVDAPADTE